MRLYRVNTDESAIVTHLCYSTSCNLVVVFGVLHLGRDSRASSNSRIPALNRRDDAQRHVLRIPFVCFARCVCAGSCNIISLPVRTCRNTRATLRRTLHPDYKQVHSFTRRLFHSQNVVHRLEGRRRTKWATTDTHAQLEVRFAPLCCVE